MLEKYLECLAQANISDFWNKDLNLLCYLSEAEMEVYKRDTAEVLDHVKNNPKNLLRYLE